MRIGIDVGGTFTDIVLIDDATGNFQYTKTSTTPHDLAEGVLLGIEKILRMADRSFDEVGYLVHGTTIGTNAIIERKGAPTGLLTTRGFIDVLEIGRVQRPQEALYDFAIDNPPPLVPRYLRRAINERLDSQGQVVEALDEDSARQAIQFLKDNRVESVAISFLFSFLNPAHEQRVRDLCRELFPEAYLSISSEIAPEFREYERTSTAVINAYLQPVTRRYVENLDRQLQERYGDVDLRIMQASGGSMTAEAAKTFAVNMVNSGPAGGVVAAAFVGQMAGFPNVVSVDMGGTSFDIGLIDGGTAKVTSDSKFVGLPVRIPIIDIDTIGAGGGSIAWIDSGAVLNVGPESAGAMPGPACYGRGGTRPTVTDANLVLGRLNPDYFLGGEMALDVGRARAAVREHVAEPMGLSVEEAAAGVIRIVNANMTKGISVNSIEKGFDVREFALVAFGGAGALHAVELAQEIGMQAVLVPPLAGNLSAMGLLVSDTRHDFVQTLKLTRETVRPEVLTETFQALESRGVEQLRRERVRDQDMEMVWSADIRYEGQSYELNIPVDRKARLDEADVAEAVRRFHEQHQRKFEYSSEAETVQFVNLRVTAIGHMPEVRLREEPSGDGQPERALKGRRPIYFQGEGFVDTPLYERDLLQPGDRFAGPALIEETVSCTVVVPGSTARIDGYRNIIVEWER